RTSRRERERREWLSQHLFQICFPSDANRHVRIESLARRDCGEIGHVVDQGFLNVASALVAEERCRGRGLHGVGLDGCDEFILQPMQIFSRFDYDSREANRRRRDIVILERLQRPCRGFSLAITAFAAANTLSRSSVRTNCCNIEMCGWCVSSRAKPFGN